MVVDQKLAVDHPSWRPTPRISGGIDESMANDLADMLGKQLVLYAEASASVKAEQSNLSRVDFKALAYVAEFEPLPTGHLAQLMGLSHGGVTAIINRLEEQGFIRRDRSVKDRRLVMLTLALESGIDLVFPDHVRRALADASRGFNTEQLLDIRQFLERCIHVLQRDTRSWLISKEQGGS